MTKRDKFRQWLQDRIGNYTSYDEIADAAEAIWDGDESQEETAYRAGERYRARAALRAQLQATGSMADICQCGCVRACHTVRVGDEATGCCICVGCNEFKIAEAALAKAKECNQ